MSITREQYLTIKVGDRVELKDGQDFYSYVTTVQVAAIVDGVPYFKFTDDDRLMPIKYGYIRSIGVADYPSSDRWDRKYLGLAKYIAGEWSKDPSTKVAAIVVNWEYSQEFIGFNGFPKGVLDLPERYADRELKYQLVTHAERNSIRKAVAARMAKGSTLYVYPSFSFPPICNECCKEAIGAGIKEIVGYEADPKDPRVQRWEESIKISRLMCTEAGITWRSLKE